MLVIPLQVLPKQSFTVVLADLLYTVDVIETGGCMSMNVTRADEVVVTGQRCVAKQLVLPYAALEDGLGNFMFLTMNDELPHYELFASTQALVFASNAELEAVRGTDAAVIVGGKVHFGAAGSCVGAAVVHGVGHV